MRFAHILRGGVLELLDGEEGDDGWLVVEAGVLLKELLQVEIEPKRNIIST